MRIVRPDAIDNKKFCGLVHDALPDLIPNPLKKIALFSELVLCHHHLCHYLYWLQSLGIEDVVPNHKIISVQRRLADVMIRAGNRESHPVELDTLKRRLEFREIYLLHGTMMRYFFTAAARSMHPLWTRFPKSSVPSCSANARSDASTISSQDFNFARNCA